MGKGAEASEQSELRSLQYLIWPGKGSRALLAKISPEAGRDLLMKDVAVLLQSLNFFLQVRGNNL